MKSQLMIYVRVKPRQVYEKSPVVVIDGQSLVFDPTSDDDQNMQALCKKPAVNNKRNKNKKYIFDRVFDESSDNIEIFRTVTEPMVNAVIGGTNCSVFTYGATGSGKTYTMLGSVDCPGVIYYTMEDLFAKLAKLNQTDTTSVELKICYYEIHNEKVRDLLVTNNKQASTITKVRLNTSEKQLDSNDYLQYHMKLGNDSGNNSFTGLNYKCLNFDKQVIPGINYLSPANVDQLIELLTLGNSNRSQHPTDANADSSRSHAVFQILLTKQTRRVDNELSESICESRTSKMSLIDLAGSERASFVYGLENGRNKHLQLEGGSINKSLLALGNCINALADSKTAKGYIPYRNSKLTRLLRDSLGGQCKTAMIATVCQRLTHYSETQNTLAYASRAKCIRTSKSCLSITTKFRVDNFLQNVSRTTTSSNIDDIILKPACQTNRFELEQAEQLNHLKIQQNKQELKLQNLESEVLSIKNQLNFVTNKKSNDFQKYLNPGFVQEQNTNLKLDLKDMKFTRSKFNAKCHIGSGLVGPFPKPRRGTIIPSSPLTLVIIHKHHLNRNGLKFDCKFEELPSNSYWVEHFILWRCFRAKGALREYFDSIKDKRKKSSIALKELLDEVYKIEG